MTTVDVGIRELKAKLSEYVAAAARGQLITVTDRGKPVAQLTSLHAESHVDLGIDEGWIEAPLRRGLAPVVRFKATESTASALDADRG